MGRTGWVRKPQDRTATPRRARHGPTLCGGGRKKSRPAQAGRLLRQGRCLQGSQALLQRSLGIDQFLGQVVRQLLEVGVVQLEFFSPGGLVDA